ncbi:MAG: hypothetical protein WCT12_34615 [Verrucomicrobiota bacterium]
MESITYQPALRPALPCVYGPLDYREQRAVYEKIDAILSASGLEQEFINLAVGDREFDTQAATGKRLARFARFSVLALRANIARNLTGLGHRDFCARLADSPLLQWFLHVGQVDSVRVFSKSTSDRFSTWASDESLHAINEKLTALLGAAGSNDNGDAAPSAVFGLPAPITCDEVFFDSTCLKADVHFPVDWVLLRDIARTLMKATVLIRKAGLKKRMPQEPLEFLSDMNTLCMKMSAKRRAADSKRQRKQVLREMKTLEKCIADHAQAHLEALRTRWQETDLSEGRVCVIIARMEGVLDQLPAAINQAHERIIGERKVQNKDKILSLYDDSINVIVRGKANAEVEFGNKLWLGESREGIIVDYMLYQDNPSDPALVKPAIQRLVDAQGLDLKHAWGDRGLFSRANQEMLEQRGIRSGLCPRAVAELADRLENETGFREGLKRRAGTEARIGIFKNVFLGRPPQAKGFAHRELVVGWAVLTHNLWVVARLALAEEKRQAEQKKEPPSRKRRAG